MVFTNLCQCHSFVLSQILSPLHYYLLSFSQNIYVPYKGGPKKIFTKASLRVNFVAIRVVLSVS